jgi:hypothetical protein
MKNIEIYDPGMCCSTGVCGPAIDPELMRMATIVNSLDRKGIKIKRHNLSSEPQDFVANKLVSALLAKEGAEVLPVTLLDGEVVKTHQYPTNEELSAWLDMRIGTRSTPLPKANINAGCNCSDGSCCQETKGV